MSLKSFLTLFVLEAIVAYYAYQYLRQYETILFLLGVATFILAVYTGLKLDRKKLHEDDVEKPVVIEKDDPQYHNDFRKVPGEMNSVTPPNPPGDQYTYSHTFEKDLADLDVTKKESKD